MKEKKSILIGNRGKVRTPICHNCDIKCFCCLGVGNVSLKFLGATKNSSSDG
jgi:hypothetical protein